MTTMQPHDVQHDPQARRFVLLAQGQRSELDYDLASSPAGDTVMRVLHTGVPPALQGQGLAAALASAALAEARARGWRVRPLCSYVRSFMQRHADTQDLLEDR